MHFVDVVPEEPLPYYWRKEHKTGSEQEGRLAYQQCLSLPIEWIHENQALLEKAAEIKALYQLSLADAWIAASAILEDAVLVHKDPEFAALDCRQMLLPYK